MNRSLGKRNPSGFRIEIVGRTESDWCDKVWNGSTRKNQKLVFRIGATGHTMTDWCVKMRNRSLGKQEVASLSERIRNQVYDVLDLVPGAR
jgi:hypothetical protein